jgi:hypothetical protein
MKKKLFLFLFLPLSLSGYSQQLEWIPFKWVKSNLSGKVYDKAAIFVPVSIDDLPDEFVMQFDTGADVTRLSGNTIEPYLKNNKLLREKLDTATSWFNNIHLHLGAVDFNRRDVLYMKNYGYVPQKLFTRKKQTVRVGSIGTDLFRDKALIIDYPNTRMAVSDSLPVEYKDLPYERIKLDSQNRAIIPFRINGKEEWLLFDTGASLQQLSTIKERALAISDSIVVDSLKGNSWGNRITLLKLKVNKPIEFAGKVLENSIVDYEKDHYFDSFYVMYDIWGTTGNAYFWNNIVIIDYKNKTFRVK